MDSISSDSELLTKSQKIQLHDSSILTVSNHNYESHMKGKLMSRHAVDVNLNESDFGNNK